MPQKRQIPPTLVSRFKRASRVLRRNNFSRFGKLRNADERRHEYPKASIHKNPTISSAPLGRVRTVSVSRTHPKVGEVIVKRHHLGRVVKKITKHGIQTQYAREPVELIRVLRRKVASYNKKFRSGPVVLKNIEAYAIGNELILMKKEKPVTLQDISTGKVKIPRFEAQFRTKKERESTMLMLQRHLIIETGITPTNFLVLGFKKGKLIIAPAMDPE